MIKKISLFLSLTFYLNAFNLTESKDIEMEALQKKINDSQLLIECMEMAQNKNSLFSCYGAPIDTELDGQEFQRKKEFLIKVKRPFIHLLKEEKECIENSIDLEHIDSCKRISNKKEKRLFLGYENPQDLIDYQAEQFRKRDMEALKLKRERYQRNKGSLKNEILESMRRIKTLQYELNREVEKLEKLQRRLF